MPSTRARRNAVSGVTARLPLMISFSRGNETPRRAAKADWVIPKGARNSSRSISPGCVGGRWVGRRRRTSGARRLVVVRDFDFVGIAILPPEADPKLVIDANTVLPRTVAPQALESIARRDAQFLKHPHTIELVELASYHRPEDGGTGVAGSPTVDAVEEVLRRAVSERPYHVSYYNDRCYMTPVAHTVTLASGASAAVAAEATARLNQVYIRGGRVRPVRSKRGLGSDERGGGVIRYADHKPTS